MGYSAQSLGIYQSWTPTFGGFSVDPTGVACNYILIGKYCFVNIYMGGNGTSNATTFTITLPHVCRYRTYSHGNGVDNGVGITYMEGYVDNNSNVLNLYKNSFTGTWTASGGKRGYISFGYFIP